MKIVLRIFIYNVEGFKIACFFAALVKLRKNVLKRDSLLNHHYRKMIDEVGNFVNGFAVVAVLCRDDRFAALLAYLLQYLVKSLVKQIAGV